MLELVTREYGPFSFHLYLLYFLKDSQTNKFELEVAKGLVAFETAF